MKKPLKIMFVEDCLDDFQIVEGMLKQSDFQAEITRVENRTSMMAALKDSSFDLVLSDCTLPQFSGFHALEIVQALRPETPFIFFSGTIGEDVAIDCLHRGASDYVLKDRPARLVPSIQRALESVREKVLRQNMETQLRQLRKMESIGRLAGEIAHDFNNLLQVLRMQLGVLALDAEHPEKVRKICRMLDKSTVRGAEMMQELLIFARKTEAHLTPLQVAERIAETVELLRMGLPPEVKLSLELNDPLPVIFADAGKLDRMLTNLVMNAKDAMPKGGTICISAQVVRFDAPVLFSAQGDDIPYLRLEIADDGVGMDEYAQHHAFEPFFTNKAEGKGTGLGLAVVYGLMQVHNGFIDLQSRAGEGTTVSLYFPVPQTSTLQGVNVEVIPTFPRLPGLPDFEDTKEVS